MSSFENFSSLNYSEAILNTAEKYSDLIPKNSLIPFLYEVEQHLNLGEEFTDALHKTMNRYHISWNDENYQTIAQAYKEAKELTDTKVDNENIDYSELYKADLLADAQAHEESLTKDLTDK